MLKNISIRILILLAIYLGMSRTALDVFAYDEASLSITSIQSLENLSGTWKVVDGKWYFYINDETLATGFQKIDNKIYYFNAEGIMHIGWNTINEQIYYFNNSGAMQIGWQYIDGFSYFFNNEGQMQNGWISDESGKYFLDENGHIKTGWYEENGKWYFLTKSAGCLTGFQVTGDVAYYFDNDGVLQTGWQEVNSQWFYFDESGIMQTGWYLEGANWYYLDKTEGRLSGLHEIEGNYYYFDENGIMLKNSWKKLDEGWMFFRKSGMLQENICKNGENWYIKNECGQWVDSGYSKEYGAVYEITEFGADGTDEESDRKNIQEALNAAGSVNTIDGKKSLVHIKAGKYFLDNLLTIYSNTDLILNNNAIVYRLNTNKSMLESGHFNERGEKCFGIECTHGEYSQIQNVSIVGGIWDGRIYDNNSNGDTLLFSFKHGSNVCIKDTVLRNSSGLHVIVLDGMKDILIKHVDFKNTYFYTGTKEGYEDYYGDYTGTENLSKEDWRKIANNKETIHIDFANKIGSIAYPLDDTICKNVTVTECTFDNVMTGVGAHHDEQAVSSLQHENITVKDNIFLNLKGVGVIAYQISNLVLENNVADSGNAFLLGIKSEIDILNNDIKNMIENGIWMYNCRVKVKENTIVNTKSGRDIMFEKCGQSICEQNIVTDRLDYNIVADNEKVQVLNNSTVNPYQGWKKVDGATFYYIDGKKQTGWVRTNGKWYYFGKTGVMKIGWLYVDGYYYYLDDYGVMQTGWKKENSEWYYMDASGIMQTGWKKIKSVWYYFNSSGVMQTGWKYINGYYYYLDSTGSMQTGWRKEDSVWYYLNSSGAMQTGWGKIKSVWYYFNSSGAMQTGWIRVADEWYYIKDSGAMYTGWLIEGNNTYYLEESSGKMCIGRKIIDGKEYIFDNVGKLKRQ